MNPLTNVKNINKLNDIEAELGVAGSKTSWHEQYKDSAYVFIGGLPFDLSEGDIICVFSQYGEIVNINLVRDKKSGKSKGYCFLAYEDQRSTTLAVDNFNGIKILGRVIRVDHVSNYRKPKEDDNDDDITKKLREEGCAPGTPSPPLSVDDEEDYPVPKKKAKKEHKIQSKSHDKKKNKKKHQRKEGKPSSKSRPDSSDSESSRSERDDSTPTLVRVKQEVDRHHSDQRNLDVMTERGERGSTARQTRYQEEFTHFKKEGNRDGGRKEQRRDRVTEGVLDSHQHGDRDRLSSDRQRSNREERRRDDNTEKRYDRGSHGREEGHPARGGGGEGDRHGGRNRDRLGDIDKQQDPERKWETDSKSWHQEPVGEWNREVQRYRDSERYEEAGAPKNENRERRREWNGSDERGERDPHRGRDLYREREGGRSGHQREGTSRERDYNNKQNR